MVGVYVQMRQFFAGLREGNLFLALALEGVGARPHPSSALRRLRSLVDRLSEFAPGHPGDQVIRR